MAGGGGGGSSFSDPRKLADSIRKAEKITDDSDFSRLVSENLSELLSKFNDRNTELTSERLSEILEKIDDLTDSTIATLFGGSVARHTYVDGLSDIDCLLALNAGDADVYSPKELMSKFSERLKKELPECEISTGKLAITVKYSDGMEIQLLPAIKDGERLKIASTDGDKWSNIRPRRFHEALTTVNDACGKKVIPTVKLIKAINDGFPESLKLTGYHIESLAINIFRNYMGVKSPKAMVQHFFEVAPQRVLSPVVDRSGQSVHVDEYLGNKDSESRKKLSAIIDRVNRRIRNAEARSSVESWTSLFKEE